MEITEALDKIINAKKGKDVRQALHDGLEACYNDATGNPESVAAVVQELATISPKVDTMEDAVIDSVTAAEIDIIFAV